jgi:hypothetical protein
MNLGVAMGAIAWMALAGCGGVPVSQEEETPKTQDDALTAVSHVTENGASTTLSRKDGNLVALVETDFATKLAVIRPTQTPERLFDLSRLGTSQRPATEDGASRLALSIYAATERASLAPPASSEPAGESTSGGVKPQAIWGCGCDWCGDDPWWWRCLHCDYCGDYVCGCLFPP